MTIGLKPTTNQPAKTTEVTSVNIQNAHVKKIMHLYSMYYIDKFKAGQKCNVYQIRLHLSGYTLYNQVSKPSDYFTTYP